MTSDLANYTRSGVTLELVVPVRTRNPLNGGTGDGLKAQIIKSRRRKAERAAAAWATRAALAQAGLTRVDLVPCTVLLTRVSAGRMDTDGLAASQKGIRDGIADALGINDGSVFVHWQYAQERGKPKYHAVRVRIERRETRWGGTDAAGSATPKPPSNELGNSG